MSNPLRSFSRCSRALLFLCLASRSRAQGPNPAAARPSIPAAAGQTSIAGTSNLNGTVSDPSGAKVPHAAIHIEAHLHAAAFATDILSDATGRFTLPLSPDTYDITIVATGFDPYVTSVTVSTSALALNARLVVAARSEEVDVPSDAAASTSAADNKSALIFKGDALKTFSDDDATFQQQIQALAGGGDEGAGPQTFVDGFSGGRFPPKNSIREIRINQNPYSAQYDTVGFNRIEIFTKPGSDGFHGFLAGSGNDNAFNSGNPYVGAQPPYHSFNVFGNASGPINKKTSAFLNVETNNLQNNAVIDATTGLDAAGNPIRTSQAIPNPTTTATYGARIDRQITTNNTLTSRYEFSQTQQTNGGVGLLVLASEGVNSTSTTQTLQLSDTQILGAKMVSEAHFQYLRTRLHQDSVSSAPTLNVEGAFSGGGSSSQFSHDNQDRYEFQEIFTRQQGAHFLRAGARYRLLRDANLSTANYNGAFTFTSLQSYAQTLTNIQNNAPLTANGGGPSQFTLTSGQPSAVVQTGDLGVFAEDEWKLTRAFTLDYGLRFETQTAIPDHLDPAPRLGVAWAIGHDKKPPILTIRGGGGLFYDRFLSSNILTSIRQNGISQIAYTVANPGFYCTGLSSSCPTLSSLSAIAPTLYQISPNLRSEYNAIAGVSLERNLFNKGSITLNFQHTRGIHLWDSVNINAPLPGTYTPGLPASGTRPLGTTQNIYQFQSSGISNTNRFFMNANMNPVKKLFFYTSFSLRFASSDTSGASSFASNSYNLRADYGRVPAPHARLFTGVFWQAPLGLQLNAFLAASSAVAFNITTGTDLNGDTQYNDRPSFATTASPAASVVRTRFGNFNTTPVAGETIIPINDGTGPAYASLTMGLGKNIRFGPRPPLPPPPPGSPAPKGPVPKPDPRYTLGFSIDADNVFNHVNGAAPVGILSSPLFGQSISLNSPFGGSANAANRVIQIRAFFEF